MNGNASWQRAARIALVAAGAAGALFVLAALVRAANVPARGAGMEEIASPQTARLPRAACVLRWTPGPPGTTYDLTVTTTSFEPVARVERLERAEYRVEPAALAAVPPGGRLLWQVTARRPIGRVVVSRPFSTVVSN